MKIDNIDYIRKKSVGGFNVKTEFGKNVFNNKDNKFLFIRCNDDLN